MAGELVDAEVAAIASIVEILDGRDPAEVARIVAYVSDRFGTGEAYETVVATNRQLIRERDEARYSADSVEALIGKAHDRLAAEVAPAGEQPGSAPAPDEPRWCVKHRDGWCAVAGNEEPAEGTDNVPTVCEYFVVLPGGYDHRVPDCDECLAAPGSAPADTQEAP